VKKLAKALVIGFIYFAMIAVLGFVLGYVACLIKGHVFDVAYAIRACLRGGAIVGISMMLVVYFGSSLR
jgi:hypothetical protein